VEFECNRIPKYSLLNYFGWIYKSSWTFPLPDFNCEKPLLEIDYKNR